LTISYNKLFKLLIDRGIKKMELKEATGMGTATLAKLSRNQPVAIEVLVKICAFLDCDIGDVMQVLPEKQSLIDEAYCRILKENLIPAVGCTEPSAIAYAASKVRETLGAVPETVIVEVSGNIVKNAKSAVVPNTGGMKGIRVAAAAGIIAGDPALGLEVLSVLDTDQRLEIISFIEECSISIALSEIDMPLYISVYAEAAGESARVTIEGNHINITLIEKNHQIIYSIEHKPNENAISPDYHLLDMENIFRFAVTTDLAALKPILDRQIEYNYAIAQEGLTGDWGANVGRALLMTFGNDIKIRAAAASAAGSDARMSGSDLPVVILSGSGNQGIAASVPVIIYAKEMNCSDDELYRALILSDLTAIHQKTSIGTLSAFCGAVSASCAAAAGVTFLKGGDYEAVAHTIVNALASVSGIVCDGAKPSCAAKIAVAFFAGLLGEGMFAEGNWQFFGGDGILAKGVDNTIANVGRLASDGMRETDREILRIMTEA